MKYLDKEAYINKEIKQAKNLADIDRIIKQYLTLALPEQIFYRVSKKLSAKKNQFNNLTF